MSVEFTHTIADNGEVKNVFPFMFFYEDFDKDQIQDHALHEHPHEGHQEQVVHENCCCLTTRIHHTLSSVRGHPNHKGQLCQNQTHTQVDVDVVTHVPQGPTLSIETLSIFSKVFSPKKDQGHNSGQHGNHR